MRQDENIRGDQEHLKASPSATARLSLMLSMLGSRIRPRSTTCVWDGSRCLGRTVKSFSPLRNASLTMSFKFASPVRRNRSIAAATSSSSVRVVLMHQGISFLMRGCQYDPFRDQERPGPYRSGAASRTPIPPRRRDRGSGSRILEGRLDAHHRIRLQRPHGAGAFFVRDVRGGEYSRHGCVFMLSIAAAAANID